MPKVSAIVVNTSSSENARSPRVLSWSRGTSSISRPFRVVIGEVVVEEAVPVGQHHVDGKVGGHLLPRRNGFG